MEGKSAYESPVLVSPTALGVCLAVIATGCADSAQLEQADAALDAAPVDAASPLAPLDLERWMVGNEADAVVGSTSPALFLAGGGSDVDEAFIWAREHVQGGDAVILRASGSDGYNEYLLDQIGGFDSVETLLVDERALAEAPYVAWQIDHAELVFIAGGDQSVYLSAWTGTPVQEALGRVWERQAVIAGTSAGAAVLGEFIFSANMGTVYSDEVLSNPYSPYVTLDRNFLRLPLLDKILVDTHFGNRDRMGRMVGFVARVLSDGWGSSAFALGIDEGTAILIEEDGSAEVVGNGKVYLLRPETKPERCQPGEALEWADISYARLQAGDTLTLPSALTDVAMELLSAQGGELTPGDPY
jgi:cyanophycinase